ncbi:MAG: hypothetical protein D6729_19055 [Deltaproteobacteria bacterium]|nr:MAG: hypothetical protein D6729_19055 [Deltaproteobacteria bacterium]
MRAVAAVLLALLLAAPARAYVLPTRALLELFEAPRGRGSTTTRHVEGTLTLFAPDGDRTSFPAVHDLELNGRCRLEIISGPFEGAHAVYARGRIVRPEASDLADLALLEALACPLVALRDGAAAAVDRLLRTHGVDLEYTGLSRLNRRPAYLIGARPWEHDRPQLWLDKEQLQPVKWVAEVDGRLGEVRLLGYSDPATGSLHPRTLELWLDGRLRLRFVAERLEQGIEFPKDHFR